METRLPPSARVRHRTAGWASRTRKLGTHVGVWEATLLVRVSGCGQSLSADEVWEANGSSPAVSGVPGAAGAMRLLWAVGCFDRLIARRFSSVARRGERPGGEELSRLLLDDLAPAQRLERLFGLSPCLLALRAARRRVARLLLQAGKAGLQGERAELLRVAEARGIPVLRPRRQKLDAWCGYQVHQGVCMEVSPLRPRPCDEVADTSSDDDPQQLWLVLEGLQDPRNLGAVMRSAHFLGVDRVITSRRNRHGRPLIPFAPDLEVEPSS